MTVNNEVSRVGTVSDFKAKESVPDKSKTIANLISVGSQEIYSLNKKPSDEGYSILHVMDEEPLPKRLDEVHSYLSQTQKVVEAIKVPRQSGESFLANSDSSVASGVNNQSITMMLNLTLFIQQYSAKLAEIDAQASHLYKDLLDKVSALNSFLQTINGIYQDALAASNRKTLKSGDQTTDPSINWNDKDFYSSVIDTKKYSAQQGGKGDCQLLFNLAEVPESLREYFEASKVDRNQLVLTLPGLQNMVADMTQQVGYGLNLNMDDNVKANVTACASSNTLTGLGSFFRTNQDTITSNMQQISQVINQYNQTIQSSSQIFLQMLKSLGVTTGQ